MSSEVPSSSKHDDHGIWRQQNTDKAVNQDSAWCNSYKIKHRHIRLQLVGTEYSHVILYTISIPCYIISTYWHQQCDQKSRCIHVRNIIQHLDKTLSIRFHAVLMVLWFCPLYFFWRSIVYFIYQILNAFHVQGPF